MFISPATVASRAASWAEIQIPDRQILSKAWDANREEIIERLEKGVKYSESVHVQVRGAGVRLPSRLRHSTRADSALIAEFDPEGVVGISSSLSRWVRDEVSPMVGSFFKDAGY